MKKKQTKRSKAKYPGLRPELNLKTRHELIADYDYLNDLNHKEKEWLNRFTEEYVSGTYDEKVRIHPLEWVKSKKRKNKIVDKYKNKAETANNNRNADIYTRKKASAQLTFFEDLNPGEEPTDDFWEDKTIFKLEPSEKTTKKKT